LTRRERQLDKLAKLLALEGSPNPHEAESARRQAERFMKRHGLCREDAVPKEYGFREEVLQGSGWAVAWRFTAATAAARHFGAEALRRGREVRIVGEHADVESAVALARRLLRAVREVEGLAARELEGASDEAADALDAEMPRRQRDLAFRTGAARGIGRVLARYCAQASSETSPPAPGAPAPGPVGAGPVPEAPAPTRAVARVEGSGRDHSARVGARYRPEVAAPEPLDEVWEAFGQYVAERNTVAGPGGTVTVSRRSK
jgi:hypothetical protein